VSQDRPTPAELVQAVREFLERDVMDATEGRVQFHTRVAINALGMIERELTLGPDLARDEAARLTALFGKPPGDLRTAERDLAARIRAGELDDRVDEVRAHVRATVREKLLVVNPGYLGDRAG
jgi:hypothetical protein